MLVWYTAVAMQTNKLSDANKALLNGAIEFMVDMLNTDNMDEQQKQFAAVALRYRIECLDERLGHEPNMCNLEERAALAEVLALLE
jgi:hypothetical protein